MNVEFRQLDSLETTDLLQPGGLQLIQAKKGYRYSLDSVLLANYACASGAQNIMDLGTGVGVIPLLLIRMAPQARIVGLERQNVMAARARRNVRLNGMENRIEIIEADLRNVRELLPGSGYDLVLSNPPYRKPGSGRIAPEDERAAARHELAGGLPDFLEAAAYLMENRGRLVMVYLAERLPELMAAMRELAIEPKRLRCVHSRQGESARMVLIEGRKGGGPGLVVEAPLYIYRGPGRDYSDEVAAIYRGPSQDSSSGL